MGVRLDPDAFGVLEGARALARARRHPTIEPLHLLGALVSHPRLEPLLTARCVNPSELAIQVEARLAESTPSGLYRDAAVAPVASARLEAVLARTGAKRLLAIFRPLTFEQLANAAFDDDSVASMLMDARAQITVAADAVAQARTFAKSRGQRWVSVYHLRTLQIAALFSGLGGDVADLMRAPVRLSGGAIDDESLPPEDDSEIAIIFHNDDFTTMDFVVKALNECFAIPAAEATAFMLDVHRRGSAVVKTCPAREARWRIEKARRAALLWAMPLRINWRPNSPPRPDG